MINLSNKNLFSQKTLKETSSRQHYHEPKKYLIIPGPIFFSKKVEIFFP